MRLMATKTTTHHVPRTHTKTQTIVVRPVAAKPSKKGHRGKGRGRQSSEKTLMGLVVGGFILGFIDKSGTSIPTIPILGRAGTIALAAHFFGKGKAGMVTDVRNSAASVAAYEFGLKGSVSGDDEAGVGRVRGHV
jgi:hypothetical protein